jgi:hypothetical protein
MPEWTKVFLALVAIIGGFTCLPEHKAEQVSLEVLARTATLIVGPTRWNTHAFASGRLPPVETH